MPITTRQLSKIANVSEQTVRNYTRDYGELLSPQARGENGNRLFSDEDVQIFRSIADLRRQDVPPAEVIKRLRVGDIYIDAKPHQATPNEPQATQTALDMPQMLFVVRSDLQRQINEIKRTQAVLVRAATLWGALLGAITALVLGAFVLWVLWLLVGIQ